MSKPVPKLKPIVQIGDVMLGCDPEFFFAQKDGTVIGAEKILPKEGLKFDPYANSGYNDETRKRYGYFETEKNPYSKTIIDGVQAELNPRPNTCREGLAREIAACFRTLHASLQKSGVDASVSFAPLVKVSKEELASLSEQSQQFGCAPSTNVYDETASIKVDPKKYLGRSAGGHIHIGSYQYYHYGKMSKEELAKNWGENWSKNWTPGKMYEALQNANVMVPMLDIIVGNTCVLLDRSPENAERRKNYGRAGEHRVKWYGIEYRPLSNFWLRSYQLMSFVTGLCRFAANIVAASDSSSPETDYVKAFTDAVNKADIVKAINENDFDLAYENFKKIEPLIAQLNPNNQSLQLSSINFKNFHHFIMRGMDHWFKQEPLAHWMSLKTQGQGWESFLTGIVANDLAAFEKIPGHEYDLTHLKKEFSKFEFEVNPPIKKKTTKKNTEQLAVLAEAPLW